MIPAHVPQFAQSHANQRPVRRTGEDASSFLLLAVLGRALALHHGLPDLKTVQKSTKFQVSF